jgi:hypothetical protein
MNLLTRELIHNNLVSSAFLMCASDGDLDKKESKVIESDVYWKKPFDAVCVEEFFELDFGNLKTLCEEEAIMHLLSKMNTWSSLTTYCG